MNDTILYGFDYILYYYYYYYNVFVGYPLVVKISIFVILASILVSVILFIRILVLYMGKVQERKILHYLKVTYRDKIKTIAVDPVVHSVEDIIVSLNYDKKKPLGVKQKRLLTRLLALFKVELSDRLNRTNYHNIILAFDLIPFFEREIQFAKPRYRMRMLMWIRYLEESVSSVVLIPQLYNRNPKIRKAAQATFMWDSSADPFRFFDNADFDSNFRPWDKIDIHNIFENRLRWNKNIPNVTQWIRAPKNEIVKPLFACEIRYWNKKDECPYLLDTFFETNNIELRCEIAKTLGYMKYVDAEQKLTGSYTAQPEKVKQAIISSVTMMQSGFSLSFLRSAYFDAVDISTKMAALEGLFDYGIQGRREFESLELRAKMSDVILFEHIKNPIINQQKREIA